MRNLSYSAETVYTHARDLFLLSLYVPASHRETLLAIYALDAELSHVHQAVFEEMIGQIRYAWWEESLQAIRDGHSPREHPVLQALPVAYIAGCIKLVENYRAAYPEMPPGQDILLDAISVEMIRKLCPEAETGWRKAKTIIDKHRVRFGPRMNSWLHLKLIVAGLF